MPSKARILVFHALVQSHIESTCEAWIPLINGGALHQLQVLQNKAVRLTEGLPNRAHVSLAYGWVGLLRVGDLAKLHLQLLHIAHRNGTLPAPIGQELMRLTELRASSRLAAQSLRLNTQSVDALILASVPEMEKGASYNSVKTRLKLSILASYQTSCVIKNCRICLPLAP
jgi:hypothetical protein